MDAERVLVTGFEPYGGRGLNPAFEIARAVDGRLVAGRTVVGRGLPVALTAMRARLAELLDEVRPCAVIALGLWPGEAMIRLERVAINVADFEIPDNDGVVLRDGQVSQAAAAAGLFASLPLRAIEAALLEAGIPAHLSSTAGTFLCNACLYSLLGAVAARGWAVPTGFIHVPYLPQQVAALLAELRTRARLESHQRSDVASMDLDTGLRAVEIAIATTLARPAA